MAQVACTVDKATRCLFELLPLCYSQSKLSKDDGRRNSANVVLGQKFSETQIQSGESFIVKALIEVHELRTVWRTEKN